MAKETWRVEFEVDVPIGTKPEDVIEWLRYELGDNGQISGSNPMSEYDLEANFGTVDITDPNE